MRNARYLQAVLKCASLAITLAIGATTGADARSAWTSFTVPDGSSTYPIAISGHNIILGTFARNGLSHGFLRAPGGTLTTFDAPDQTHGTFPTGISADGTVVGYFGNDSAGSSHGFIRNPKGQFATLDIGAFWTVAYAINAKGVVSGIYSDGPSVRCFVREPDGSVTTFTVPGATYFLANTINRSGTVAGTFFDAQSNAHGFVRDRHGAITTFDAPQATFATGVTSINDDGQIVGTYDGGHGYLRLPDATTVTVDPVGPQFGNVQLAQANSINSQGYIAGCYSDGTTYHGFVRSPAGAYVKLDGPGATTTCPLMIGQDGKVVGWDNAGGDMTGFKLNWAGVGF